MAPNVFVSTMSLPAAKYASWIAADDVGPGDVEDLVAALEPVEVVQRQVRGLQHRAHRPVGDENTFREGFQQVRARLGHGD